MAVVACGSAGKLPLVVLRGFELTEDYLIKNGFRRPILVRCKDGLDLRVPPEKSAQYLNLIRLDFYTCPTFCVM